MFTCLLLLICLRRRICVICIIMSKKSQHCREIQSYTLSSILVQLFHVQFSIHCTHCHSSHQLASQQHVTLKLASFSARHCSCSLRVPQAIDLFFQLQLYFSCTVQTAIQHIVIFKFHILCGQFMYYVYIYIQYIYIVIIIIIFSSFPSTGFFFLQQGSLVQLLPLPKWVNSHVTGCPICIYE